MKQKGENKKMKNNFLKNNLTSAALALAVGLTAFPGLLSASTGGSAPPNLNEQVRHELLMLPYFTVFDNLAFDVNGSNVTLLGEVRNPVLKADAERTVKRIPGVESVANKITVLPLSPMDDHIRLATARAIYGYAPLQRYAMGVQKPIRIIVDNGHVTLTGVVANEMDRNLAYMRANQVPGVFSVTNDLRIDRPSQT